MERDTKILIVDDEDIVHKSCRRILQDGSYAIDSVYSAEEALEKLDGNSYDIIISDLIMHGMDGMEFLHIIKDRRIDVTVIIFTGYATAETARKALKMGAFDYIPKPFTPEEFMDVILNAVESRKNNPNSQMLDLMAIVSHELKSPVSVVQTTAETLYGGYLGNLEPKQQEIVEKIIRNCQYLEDIIRSYIDLAKVELDNIESFARDIDFVADVIKPVIDIPENNDNYRRMNLVTDMPGSLIISADPNLLKIVVTNLVSNAIKYGKDDTGIIIALADDGDSARFSVYNEGVGISDDAIKTTLFNKFARLKQKGTEGVKGTGLGLYMCRKIVEKHKGRIFAESQENRWVKFTVVLPKNR
ncbi:MAG: response regulator [Spirochaetia bacterium]|jgi:signal transduction histidine kinase|nr:response regulator [Spirochaetia bacterium]